MKKISIILIVAMVVSSLFSSCSNASAESKYTTEWEKIYKIAQKTAKYFSKGKLSIKEYKNGKLFEIYDFKLQIEEEKITLNVERRFHWDYELQTKFVITKDNPKYLKYVRGLFSKIVQGSL